MNRDFNRLADGPFDLLVIGGGIYGAWTALDAAQRGLSVAIIDKGDWACGTSMASTKLIHGGLRYLEHLRLDLVRTSLEERKTLSVIAPHRVTPVRFFIPMYQDNRVGPIKLKTGLWLYDLMAGKGQPVDHHSRLSRSEALERYSFLEGDPIQGGFTYGDCQTDDFRMVLDVIHGACQTGAVAVNYAKAVGLISEGRQVKGAVVQDLLSGHTSEVRADVVVNAAGPWVPLVDDIHLLSSYVRYSKGVHLVMPPLPTNDALLLMAGGDNRIFFVVPWYGQSLLGTTDGEYHGHPDHVGVEDADVDYLLAEAGRHLKGIDWNRNSVKGGFAGLRTLQNEPGRPLSQVTREWSLLEPRPGLLVSIGGKFTTARLDASRIVSRALQMLHRTQEAAAPTDGFSLPSTPRDHYASWRKAMMRQVLSVGVNEPTAACLISRFGEQLPLLMARMEQDPQLAQPIAPSLPFCWAEVDHCVRNEMVVHLEDLLRRRIPLTILSRPDADLAAAVAAAAARHMGWSPEDCAQEVAYVMSRWWSA